MDLASRVQKKPAMGRLVSVVSRRAEANGSATFFTQTFRVSFHGFRNATYLPSGDSCAPAISGLPNRSSRSINGGSPWDAFAGALFWAETVATRKSVEMVIENSFFMEFGPLENAALIRRDFGECCKPSSPSQHAPATRICCIVPQSVAQIRFTFQKLVDNALHRGA